LHEKSCCSNRCTYRAICAFEYGFGPRVCLISARIHLTPKFFSLR
jgi:hypothetical protein